MQNDPNPPDLRSIEIAKTYKLIFTEWITTIAVILGCFGYLAFKIEKQADRTDHLYEMFIDLVRDNKK